MTAAINTSALTARKTVLMRRLAHAQSVRSCIGQNDSDHFGEVDLYDMVIIDRELTAQEISDLESYLAGLNGVTL